MPFIEARQNPSSSKFGFLRKRPASIKTLGSDEIIRVPVGQKLGVLFPYEDADKQIQAIRLVAPAKDLGLVGGEILYTNVDEFLVGGKSGLKPWLPATPQKSLVPNFLKGRKQYKPNLIRGDKHIVIVDDENKTTSQMTCYDHNGQKLWVKDCLARGQSANEDVYAGDTPTGLYQLGQIWIADPSDVSICKPYGTHCVDMETLEDGENRVNRAGICMHGGGSALGYDACNADKQTLYPTFGCVRVFNIDMKETIVPMVQECNKNDRKVYVSVYQI